jgi:hypothetical protein
LADEKVSVVVHRVLNYTYQNVNEEENVQTSVDPTESHSNTHNVLQKTLL